jgi:hypothetical protein
LTFFPYSQSRPIRSRCSKWLAIFLQRCSLTGCLHFGQKARRSSFATASSAVIVFLSLGFSSAIFIRARIQHPPFVAGFYRSGPWITFPATKIGLDIAIACEDNKPMTMHIILPTIEGGFVWVSDMGAGGGRPTITCTLIRCCIYQRRTLAALKRKRKKAKEEKLAKTDKP